MELEEQNERPPTELEERFIDEYLSNGYNGVRAYLTVNPDVDYDTASSKANSLLRKGFARKILQLSRNASRQQSIITFENQVQELQELINSCKFEGIDGKGTIKDRSNWFKAIQELNKMAGLIIDRSEVKTSQAIEINLDLSPASDVKSIDGTINAILPDAPDNEKLLNPLDDSELTTE